MLVSFFSPFVFCIVLNQIQHCYFVILLVVKCERHFPFKSRQKQQLFCHHTSSIEPTTARDTATCNVKRVRPPFPDWPQTSRRTVRLDEKHVTSKSLTLLLMLFKRTYVNRIWGSASVTTVINNKGERHKTGLRQVTHIHHCRGLFPKMTRFKLFAAGLLSTSLKI